MAVVNGNTISIYVDNVIIGCLTNATTSLSRASIETTCKDNGGARTFIPGGDQATFSFDGNYNPASTQGFSDLVGIWENKTRVGIKMYDTDSGYSIVCYAYLPTLTWTGPLNAAATFSGSFESDSAITGQAGT